MNRVERELLLHCLQSVQPGLPAREVRGQTTCFVFEDGHIHTYNDEIACKIPSPLGDFTGAIQSQKLLEMLQKLTEETLEFEQTENQLHFHGKNGRKAYFNLESDNPIPIKEIETPKKWSKINDTFSEAVQFVQQCSSKDEDYFDLTCIHITDSFVEAHNNYQLCRWNLKTGFKNPVLVRQAAMKHVAVLGLTYVSETEAWIHFKGDSGLILSCRRYVMDYKDLSPIINSTKGHPTTLPKGLIEAADKASTMLDDTEDGGMVFVEIRPGKLRISSEGVRGGYIEPKKIDYDGKPLSFLVTPKLLIDLVKRHNDCFISDSKIRVTNGDYTYISCLSKPKSKKEAAEEYEGEQEESE